MVEDESSNTSCTGRVIHTPTTPGLITRTYMPLKHCQTSTFLTPPRLDDQQYKEALKIPKRTPIPLPLWPPTPTTTALHFAASFKALATTQLASTSVTNFEPATVAPLNKFSLDPLSHSSQCPTLPPPFLFHPALHLQSMTLTILPTLSPLLPLKAQLIRKWLCPMSR